MATVICLAWVAPAQAANADAGAGGLDCVITPSAQVALSSAVDGLLSEVLVDRSDRIARGDVVAVLEDSVQQAAALLARKWSTYDTEIKLEEASLRHENRRRKRMDELYQRRQVPQESKEEVDIKVVLGRLKVKEATERRHLRRLEANQAAAALALRTVRSPVDGVVVERLRSPGEFVEDDPIVRVATLDPLHIETIVPMAQFGSIEVGMPAQVYPEGPLSGPVDAVVEKVDALGDAASGTFGVRLTLPNADNAVPAGLKCRVVIDARTPAERGDAS